MTVTTTLFPYSRNERSLPIHVLYTTSQQVLRGAKSIKWSDEMVVKPSNWAGQILVLKRMDRLTDYVESYTIYANLYDPYQSTAVIRAIQWDWRAARKMVHADPRAFKLVMAARFVEIQVEIVKSWLMRFSEILITMGQIGVNNNVPIRTLKIVIDTLHCALEKTWQYEDNSVAELNQAWEATWLEIKTQVSQRPVVKYVSEAYPDGQPEVTYDFDAFVV